MDLAEDSPVFLPNAPGVPASELLRCWRSTLVSEQGEHDDDPLLTVTQELADLASRVGSVAISAGHKPGAPDGGQCRLVANQQRPVVEVVRRGADALVKKPDAVPRGRIERKSRGRPDVPVPVPVDDEVDVDFAGFRPRVADRIGAHPRASRLRRCEVLQVPADLGRAARQREHVLPFAGEEQTAPVVGTAPRKPVESSKCQPDVARAKSYGPHDFGHHECTFGRSVLFQPIR